MTSFQHQSHNAYAVLDFFFFFLTHYSTVLSLFCGVKKRSIQSLSPAFEQMCLAWSEYWSIDLIRSFEVEAVSESTAM
jgi:hypothetical protein